MMNVQRVVLMQHADGTVTGKLQEADTFLWDGGPESHPQWHDVRELSVAKTGDGNITVLDSERREDEEGSKDE